MIKKASFLTLTGILVAFLACVPKPAEQEESFEWGGTRVWLERLNDSLNMVFLSRNGENLDSLLLPWPVYRFEHGDLNGDSIPEFAVGVIKETPYWHQKDKRIFIYQIYKRSCIIPLWRGSQVASKLVDFKLDKSTSSSTVHTLELRKDSSLYEAEYYLGKFGLVFKRYLQENSSINHFNKK